jgi:NAD(P)-dependent dehydrogenase (short-subunit alcohol dehydrogenase family)
VIELAGRAALVTGGADTLGRALAQVLIEHGMRVAIADINEARLAAHMLGSPPALSLQLLDVTDPPAWRRATDAVEARIGPIALLCNNAGIAGARAPMLDLTVYRWRHMLDVGLTGIFLGICEIAPRMIARREGHILNSASLGGFLAQKDHGDYCAAKAGVIRLSEVLRTEVEAHGIRGSVLCPGAIGHPVGHVPAETDPSAAEGRMDPVLGVRAALNAMLGGGVLSVYPQRGACAHRPPWRMRVGGIRPPR